MGYFKFYNFQIFIKPRDIYGPSMVREFYETYGKAIPKRKRKVKVVLEHLDAVEIRGVLQVPCSEIEINDIWRCTYRYENNIEDIIKV